MDSTLLLNGRETQFTPGQTILEVARQNRVHIPTLCYLERTSPLAACRICVVELQGSDILVPACATAANEGMDIRTDSKRVLAARKEILKMLIGRGHHDCPVCDKAGECGLQDLVHEYGIEDVPMTAPPQGPPPEYATSYIRYWPERCILCYRCVAACRDVKHIRAIDIEGTGNQGRVVPVNPDICESCGECLLACPTGALTENLSRYKTRTWLCERVPTTCTFCGCGCRMELNVQKNRVVGITSLEGVGSNLGSLCVRGRFGYEFISDPDRLVRPLVRKNGVLHETTWEEALRVTAEQFLKIKEDFGPDSIGGLISSGSTNEEAYLFQRFLRTCVGTNNVDSPAGSTHWTALKELRNSLGLAGMTNPIFDLLKSRTILVVGSDTTREHPVFANFLLEAVCRQEARLLVIDPEPTRLTEMADLWLRPGQGTEPDLVNGLLFHLFQQNLQDQEFISSQTSGHEELKSSLARFSLEAVASRTKVPEDGLRKAAELYAGADTGAIVFGSELKGIQKKQALVRGLINLALACGNIGVEGGGLYPLSSGGNEQGLCDLGVLPGFFPGYQDISHKEARRKLMHTWDVQRLPESPGLTRPEMFAQASAGKLRSLYIIGDNPLDVEQEQEHDRREAEESLRKLSFLVVQDIFLTETALKADVVLPGTCFGEKEGSLTNSERLVQRVRKGLNPPGEARGDQGIIMDLARRMRVPMDFKTSAAVMEEIAGVTPLLAGIRYRRLEKGGLAWPCPTLQHPGTPRLYTEGFKERRAVFAKVSEE